MFISKLFNFVDVNSIFASCGNNDQECLINSNLVDFLCSIQNQACLDKASEMFLALPIEFFYLNGSSPVDM